MGDDLCMFMLDDPVQFSERDRTLAAAGVSNALRPMRSDVTNTSLGDAKLPRAARLKAV